VGYSAYANAAGIGNSWLSLLPLLFFLSIVIVMLVLTFATEFDQVIKQLETFH